jgi:hypothetical protein
MPIKEKILTLFLFVFATVIVSEFFLSDKTTEFMVNPSEQISNENYFQTLTSSDGKTEAEIISDPEKKSTEGRVPIKERFTKEEALAIADNVKGVYMNENVANTRSSSLRKNIVDLIYDTDLNAVVIDIKEFDGPYLPESLKIFIDELHKNNVWVIARICAFRDSSLLVQHPDWYLKQDVYNSTTDATTTEFWRDNGENYWLDPADSEVQNYIIEFSKEAIDFGFVELQFDYIRFPSRKVNEIIYPVYDAFQQSKFDVMKDFFANLSESLRNYKKSIILSVDLFGYVASFYQASEIGQRISDISNNFDYVSFMIYPSHFYDGFAVAQDIKRNLPALNFPYTASDTEAVVSNHPYEVVYRSILIASDFLKELKSKTKIRPWLQRFELKADRMGNYYDAEKIRQEIKAAKDAGASVVAVECGKRYMKTLNF